ncbi:Disks large-associated protein 2 [Larimichthys crocea]|uniref:Disks large-associated protein 2 n=1 Tax=Larimichthys crocea TaxID=215358 RepID=A0A6G0IE21_LARCR|nr:Disks large-associated protein 2 [Larimichthys crocea]
MELTVAEVPQDDWGGYPGDGKDDEIPCRRMRSSSYVKAMGDEESGESDSSPKTSPQKLVRPDALVKAIIRPRDLLDSQSQSYHLQATRDMHPSIALDPSANYNSPKFRSRNQSYMRAVSTLSQASCVSQVSQVSETEINGQFESVCESVFSEVESQAMEALDLPGCFRTRSHSYLRAIQAGYSQDDDCIPPMTSTVTSTIRSTTDRNYVQEDSCLPDQASVHEDLADTAPLTHDDLGCPIRRDRLYQDNMGATAKPLSGPPVSPSLFRSPRSSAPERPSPKAIQASIKESATLAAAISMQWKEEVSAMRRELADLRRDLCKELRAFNSNFNTFTQHYNTWSPQGANMAAGADVGLSGGVGTGTGSRSGAGVGAGGLGTSVADRGTGGAREKKPQVSKVSVGTQARSKHLVRQSTADAAVNCPEEKEEMKAETQFSPEAESQDSEWPPLPEPLDTTPIYHADLVHFDLVMLTSLDQDDLDSVFMDPEPDPFDLSIDSPSNTEDLDPPIYQSDCPSSPLPAIDPATLCPLDPSQSTESVCSDPALDYHLSPIPQDVSSEFPQVTVTISPPSSVSPDTSLEMDFGPTSPAPDPLPPDTAPSPSPPPSPSDLADFPMEDVDLPHVEPDDMIVETVECMAVSQEYLDLVEGVPRGSPERPSSEQAFLWCRWQKRGQRRDSMHRSASVELWSGRYDYNSAEITYVSLTL